MGRMRGENEEENKGDIVRYHLPPPSNRSADSCPLAFLQIISLLLLSPLPYTPPGHPLFMVIQGHPLRSVFCQYIGSLIRALVMYNRGLYDVLYQTSYINYVVRFLQPRSVYLMYVYIELLKSFKYFLIS